MFGYIKPREGAHENEVTKDPNAEEIYDEWFWRFEGFHCGLRNQMIPNGLNTCL